MRVFKLISFIAVSLFIQTGFASEDCKDQQYCLGQVVDDAHFAAWNIDVKPTGEGLPKGSGKYSDGKALFAQQCASCHGVGGKGGVKMNPKDGSLPTLVNKAPLPSKSIGSYWPYASTLFDYIQRAMPFYTPKSLTPDQVYSLVSYLLTENGVIKQSMVVNQSNLASIKMPNAEGFICDNRPDVSNIACMADCAVPSDKDFDVGIAVFTSKKTQQKDCLRLPVLM